VRGLQPWPGAQTGFRGVPLHVWKTKSPALVNENKSATGGSRAVQGDRPTAAPGQVLSPKPLVVACGEGVLELLEVQLEGRKRISAADFANGQRLTDNDILGATRI
jgi:methionyl-tRNA formyltransferase